MFRRERIEYKTEDQVRTMRRAGLVVADALAAVRALARPGMTTADLDAAAASVIRAAGATPSFLGYHGYPATLCVAVNDEWRIRTNGWASIGLGIALSTNSYAGTLGHWRPIAGVFDE